MKNLGVRPVVEAGTSEDAAVWLSGWWRRVVPGLRPGPPGVLLEGHCQGFPSFSPPRLRSDPGAVGGVTRVAGLKLWDLWRVAGWGGEGDAVASTGDAPGQAGAVGALWAEGEAVRHWRSSEEGADESGDEKCRSGVGVTAGGWR